MTHRIPGDISVPTTETQNDSAMRRTVTAAVAFVATLTISAALLISVAGIGTASAETPAERCARETSAYNAAWASSWAAANPSQSPSNAPPPPVPYVCAEPQDPTTTPTSPTTTAPGLPQATDPGTGPNAGAHAPTDIPAPGETPIVLAPRHGAPPMQPPNPSDLGESPPRQLPGLRTQASTPATPRGNFEPYDRQPQAWSTCYGDSGSKVARAKPFHRRATLTYDGHSMPEGTSQMYCGWHDHNSDKGEGMKHIEARHADEWEDIDPSWQWKNNADVSMQEALENPIGTEYRPSNDTFTYCGVLAGRDPGRSGKPTGQFKFVNVVVAAQDGKIITAYPSDVPSCSRVMPGFV